MMTAPFALHAQAPTSSRQLGTVKSVEGSTVTLTTASGANVTVMVSPTAPVLQLPPGSTDLKSATPAALGDVVAGDRMLAVGAAGDTPGTLTATRVILMKSSDIAARNVAEERDWRRRGTGGLVKTVEGNDITVSAGSRMVKVDTTPTTVFKRYADGSVNFADAKASTLTEIHPGDQLRARGALSDDRSSITAEEVVSGTFDNFSGVLTAVNATTNTLTLKDLASKRMITVTVTPKSDLRKLTPQEAAAFGARNHPGAAAGASPGGAAGANPAAAGGAARTAGPGSGGAAAGRRAGADLSQMLAHLPTETPGDLKAGEAVMVVASGGSGGNPTVITLLSGVESVLSATPAGAQPLTLSPWSIGDPEAGAGGPQ